MIKGILPYLCLIMFLFSPHGLISYLFLASAYYVQPLSFFQRLSFGSILEQNFFHHTAFFYLNRPCTFLLHLFCFWLPHILVWTLNSSLHPHLSQWLQSCSYQRKLSGLLHLCNQYSQPHFQLKDKEILPYGVDYLTLGPPFFIINKLSYIWRNIVSRKPRNLSALPYERLLN